MNEPPAFPSSETGVRMVNEKYCAGPGHRLPVAAADQDTGQSLTYTLGSVDFALFTIVAGTGQLQTKENLDYERKSHYSVTVSVSDGEDADGNSDAAVDATIRVTIVVKDVNEQPAFALETDTRKIAEDAAPETDIGNPVTATDPDNDYTLSYSLESANEELFRINASSGQLQTKAPLDFEGKASYSVTVAVHDGKADDGSPEMTTDDTIDVTITITDVEEPGTVTLSLVQPQVGTALTATLTDPDGDLYR